MRKQKLLEQPPREILAVVFFKEESGNEYVRKWLKSLPKKVQQIIEDDIRVLLKLKL